MRQRAISAAVLVPVLLVVLALGGAVLAAAVALITALAAIEVFRLLKRAGYGPFAALGTALALVVVLDAAFPRVLEGSGLLLVAVGMVLDRGRGVHQDRSERRAAGLDGDRLRRAVRLAAGVHHPPRAWSHRRSRPARRSSPIGAERGWVLLLILAVWSYDTGAYLVGKNIGRTRFLTHISPSKTVEGSSAGWSPRRSSSR